MNINDIDTVSYDEEALSLKIIDQTLLPGEIKILDLTCAKEIWDAIYRLQVRGAPAIGVAAAIGLYVVCRREAQKPDSKITDSESFAEFMDETGKYLNSSRPTAVNLSWAIKRMCKKCREAAGSEEVSELIEIMKKEALAIRDEDIAMCRAIGENALTLIKPGDGILTHCNAGKLCAVRYGTATAPMYLAHEKGWDLHIYCDETRPLLQGARLTAYELSETGMEVTLQCDNMAASLMKSGRINAVITGADRIAANGDAANKIGTLGAAIIASRFGVPFYICAPSSTIDPDTPDGDHIVIEQRPGEEVTSMWYEHPMAPKNIDVYNPAFDVTDHSLISAIITEKGVFKAPFDFKEAK